MLLRTVQQVDNAPVAATHTPFGLPVLPDVNITYIRCCAASVIR